MAPFHLAFGQFLSKLFVSWIWAFAPIVVVWCSLYAELLFSKSQDVQSKETDGREQEQTILNSAANHFIHIFCHQWTSACSKSLVSGQGPLVSDSLPSYLSVLVARGVKLYLYPSGGWRKFFGKNLWQN